MELWEVCPVVVRRDLWIGRGQAGSQREVLVSVLCLPSGGIIEGVDEMIVRDPRFRRRSSLARWTTQES